MEHDVWKAKIRRLSLERGPRRTGSLVQSFRAANFMRQAEGAAKVQLECPPGFVQFQDSCIPEEPTDE